ncbi:LuxR C-terminal-related transcriptional regulator [Methylomonas montana]|uniref:response regulator transcription factor n=1 Tax=Methylomonas montana TaxID=3058963 RepID=UPI00265B2729|nr:LuxR C-terminal-related transcriptional regulator [Methylomonas montana]WKJ91224.1 LuxR C-terminal-related transcriptional regulator [Methylomonas montana]
MQKRVLERMGARRFEQATADLTASPTNREFEVLRLIGFGFGTRQIAEKLKRSVKTIEAHRANIKEKLGLKTGTELIRYAIMWIKDKD